MEGGRFKRCLYRYVNSTLIKCFFGSFAYLRGGSQKGILKMTTGRGVLGRGQPLTLGHFNAISQVSISPINDRGNEFTTDKRVLQSCKPVTTSNFIIRIGLTDSRIKILRIFQKSMNISLDISHGRESGGTFQIQKKNQKLKASF